MKVAVAVIFDDQQRILLTRRALHVPHGGQWEFPGGKLEPNESPEQALVREIKEEVGLEILDYHLAGEVKHDYSTKQVHLLIFFVKKFNGKPSCQDGQIDLRWVEKQDLSFYSFPEANLRILEMLHTQ